MLAEVVVRLCAHSASAADAVVSWAPLTSFHRQDGHVLLSHVETAKVSDHGGKACLALKFRRDCLRDAAHASGGLLQLEFVECSPADHRAPAAFAEFADAVTRRVARH